MRFFLFLLIILLSNTCINAQKWDFGKGFGGAVGVSMALGSHVNRVGFTAKFYYAHPYFQVNLNTGTWYYAESLGSEKSGWEGQIKLGVVGCWGKTDSLASPFLHELGNQNARPYSVGYSYNFYFNNIGTTQFTGNFGFKIKGFRFQIENDFLAFQMQDRYRSGSMGFFYRHQNVEVGTYVFAWTGDPYYKDAEWIKDSKTFKAKYGYMNMEGAPFGDRSAGIWAASIEYFMPESAQYFNAHIGVDAEQVRNTFQNKIIHDSPFLKNPHIPMVCTDGKPYLYLEGQEIRKPLFFMQLGWNGLGFW